MPNFKTQALNLVRLMSSRAFAVSVLSVVMAAAIYQTASMVNTVSINDEGQTTLAYTFERDPDAILRDHGILTMSADEVDFTGLENNYGEIFINRAFPVQVTADGRTHTLQVVDGTVGSLLEELNIHPAACDILSESPEKPLEEGDHITLQRVEYVQHSEEEVIPHEVETRPTSLLRPGRTLVLQQGRDGSKTLSYSQRTVDGVVEEEHLESETIDAQPVTHVVLQGAEGAPISPLDFDVPTDENGIPTQYRTVLTDQVATGYNASGRARGASGQRLSAGYVAVHPEEIPYGTRMYIASADGSFVYGYAIAADTGTALMDNVIDVDLYYDSYEESCLNGRKTVNIYLLD